jgi:DNA polymerase-3 subunit epsilon
MHVRGGGHAITSEEGGQERGRPLLMATPEEMECVLRWLEQPGTRLVEVEGEWVQPIHGAQALLAARPELRHDQDRHRSLQ